jgi:DNA-binding transcriptional MocR family regulator
VTRPGDAVIVESPTFYGALQALERLGLQAVEVPTHPREGVDLAALAHAIERHAPAQACWLMTTFQNPLGSLMPDAEEEGTWSNCWRSHEHAADRGRRVCRALLRGQAAVAGQGLRHAGAGAALFVVLEVPGAGLPHRLDIGRAAIAARPWRDQKLTSTLGTSAPAQLALAAYLEKGGLDKHLRKLRQTLAMQQATFAQAVGHYFPEGTRATRPLGGYFLWVELPAQVDALDIHRKALALGISVAPGPIFSATRAFTHCLRLNYGHAWNAQSEKAMRTLGRLVSEAAGGTA